MHSACKQSVQGAVLNRAADVSIWYLCILEVCCAYSMHLEFVDQGWKADMWSVAAGDASKVQDREVCSKADSV